MIKRIAAHIIGLAIGMSLVSLATAETKDENSSSSNEMENEVRTAVYDLFDKQSVVLNFEPGSDKLSESDVNKMKSQIAANIGESIIEKIYVGVWASTELPKADATSEKAEAKQDSAEDLVDSRVKSIKQALTQMAAGVKVESFNMAVTPNWFERKLNLDEAKVKSAMKENGEKGENEKEYSDKDDKKIVYLDRDDQKFASLGRTFSKKGGPDMAVVVLETKPVAMSN